MQVSESESCVKAMNDQEQPLPRQHAQVEHAGAFAPADALHENAQHDTADGRDAPAVPVTLEDERLVVWLGDAPYLVRLPTLREVLFTVPPFIALPFSPPWLWGIFPLRTDLVPLCDPVPMLMRGPGADSAALAAASSAMPSAMPSVVSSATRSTLPEEPQAIVVGEGERLIALLVQRIGEIRSLQPGEVQPLHPGAMPAGAPLPRYLPGSVVTPELGRNALALDVACLADDMLSALEERPLHE